MAKPKEEKAILYAIQKLQYLDCKDLHHKPKHYHYSQDPCLARKELEAHIQVLEGLILKNQ